MELSKKLSGLSVILFLFIAVGSSGQAKTRKLSSVINHPSLNIFAPYISADANAIVFLSDNAEDNALTPFFSFRENADWQEPQVLPKTIHTRLSFLRGYSLSADGSQLLYSTIKSPGVGGYDIWIANWKSNVWTAPANLGAPVNSRSHEACPSLSSDGKTLYFMRCDVMDQLTADRCRLYRVEKKSNGQWGEPEELPDYINTGNSQTPRIMADGETLIFSSDKMTNGKGGMDLFVTKYVTGKWSSPVPLDFVNTAKDDQYISVTGLGRYLLRDSPGSRKQELIEYLIPGELRPRGMMKVDGKVVDGMGKPVPGYISLVDLETGERIYNGRPNSDGSFLLYVREGRRYDLSVDPEHGDKSYFSRILDLTQEPTPQVQKVRAVLKTVTPGDEVDLSAIAFKENSPELDLQTSERALQRLARLVTANPGLKFELEVTMEGYQEDSVQSSPDLTEMQIDTVYWKYVDIDTLGQLYEKDTTSFDILYHNDRTPLQAQAIVDYLVAKGANPANLSFTTGASPAVVTGIRRVVVKGRVTDM
jgi:hypothetical protein